MSETPMSETSPSKMPVENPSLTPLTPPTQPSSLDQAAVIDYVRSAERAKLYNKFYSEEATKIEVNCTVAIDAQTDHGVYATTECRVSAIYTSNTVADQGAMPTKYYVSTDRTLRIGHQDVTRRDRSSSNSYSAADSSENIPADKGQATLGVYNFDANAHTLSVTVTYPDADATVISEEIDLPTMAGQTFPYLARRRGSYVTTVTVDDGPTRNHEWTLSSDQPAPTATIFCQPGGGLVGGTISEGSWG